MVNFILKFSVHLIETVAKKMTENCLLSLRCTKMCIYKNDVTLNFFSVVLV